MHHEFTSLWLLAAQEDESTLTGIVDVLAARHGTPRFHPHLTLLGDIPRAPDNMGDIARAIARTAPPFSAPVRDVVSGEAFFRSFYALFDVNRELAALRAAAEKEVAPAGESFMPHVSLLYGAVQEPDKSNSIGEIRSRLAGLPIRFDRLAITNSANDVPISEWQVLEVVPLGGR